MSTSKPVSEIGPFLEQRAREANPIFYNDLTTLFGLPPVGEAWFSHPLCGIFGYLDAQDHAEGRPFRTALVVGRGESIPGNGFFKMLHDLRGVQYPIRGQLAKIRIWKHEFDRLVAFYKQP